MALTPEARDLLIRTLIGEAGNQGPQGMQAVANVIRNRAESGAWKGLTDTIRARKQFSLWNPGNKAGAMAMSVDPNSPSYQNAARVADGVFSGDLGDITGGATHYYNPSVANPDWGQGPGQMIGAHKFMKLPLTAANTDGTAVTGPSSVGTGGNGGDGDADASRQYLASLTAHPDRAGDTANLNPAFATRLAAAIKQARDAGLPVSVMSAYRDDKQTGSAYDAGGNSSHGYGLASDIAGLDGPNGKITQAWAQIAAQNGLHNPYGVNNKAEFNHWQLPSKPLEQTPELLASLKAARATGDYQKVWDAYSAADASGPGVQGPIMEPSEVQEPAGIQQSGQQQQAASPYFIGDSIAEGLRQTAKGDGDTLVGRSPAAVLRAINAATPAQLQGHPVVLSTGISNNPADLASVQAQFDALKAKGVNPADIKVVGLGSRSDIAAASPALQKLVAQNGASYTGDFQAGADGVHPADYGGVLKSLNIGGAASANAPSAEAQPMSAVAPAGASPIPGGGQSQPAASPGRFGVVQGMTTGTGRNPQLTTALNLDGLFGGGSSAAPAAAPFSRPRQVPDTAQRVPLAQTPQPPTGRPTGPIDTSYGPQQPLRDAWNDKPSGQPDPPENRLVNTMPDGSRAPWTIAQSDPPENRLVNTMPDGSRAPWILPSSTSPTAASIAPASLLSGLFGATTPNDPLTQEQQLGPNKYIPPMVTPGAPSMGFPAMSGNPFQNLLKSLFG